MLILGIVICTALRSGGCISASSGTAGGGETSSVSWRNIVIGLHYVKANAWNSGTATAIVTTALMMSARGTIDAAGRRLPGGTVLADAFIAVDSRRYFRRMVLWRDTRGRQPVSVG